MLLVQNERNNVLVFLLNYVQSLRVVNLDSMCDKYSRNSSK